MERAAHAASSDSNQGGGELYTTEMESGSANEDWYPHNIELGCTVCQAPKPVYTRWGSLSCPKDSTKMYEGFMSSASAHTSGGGYNVLCLTQHSKAPPDASTG